MLVAEGKGGFRVYDVASIGNKGFSERIVRAPISPLGHDTHVKTKNATCMAIATTQPISVSRNESIVKNFPQNHEQVMHDIYRYAVITDSVEGLVLRSEEHTSELQSLMRTSYAVFCLKQKTSHITDNGLQHPATKH